MFNSNARVQVAMPEPRRTRLLESLTVAGFDVFGNDPTEAECRHFTQTICPDVVLLGVCLHQEIGWRIMSTIRTIHPNIKIMVLTEMVDPICLARAVTYGATAYLSVDTPSSQIALLTQALLNGVQLFDPNALRIALSAVATGIFSNEQQVKLALLTGAEEAVLRLLVAGCNNAGIAQQLNISTNTVKTHLRHIYDKIQVTDRTQAAVWAVRQGIG